MVGVEPVRVVRVRVRRRVGVRMGVGMVVRSVVVRVRHRGGAHVTHDEPLLRVRLDLRRLCGLLLPL